MKKKIFILMLTLLPLHTLVCSAQSRREFFYDVKFNAGNNWTFLMMGLLQSGLSALEEELEVSLPIGFGSQIRIMNTGRHEDSDMGFDGRHVWGFRAIDLFRDLEASGRFGYQPFGLPVGFYATFGYRHENFSFQLDRANDPSSIRHMRGYIRPGAGIRFCPRTNTRVRPLLELGSTWDIPVYYDGGFNNDIDQLNKGLASKIGVGIKAGAWTSTLTFEIQHYDTFNRNFIAADGSQPYKDLRTNHVTIGASFSKDF
jgi:hypothetical protein